MKIQWDMDIYKGMSEDAISLCDDAKSWICQHEALSSKYVDKIEENHPALWFSKVMTSVELAIDSKEIDAVDLGCLYIINARKAPFGKIHKSNVLRRLKRNHELIKHEFIPQFIETYERLRGMQYPAREVKELEKLIKILCSPITGEGPGVLRTFCRSPWFKKIKTYC